MSSTEEHEIFEMDENKRLDYQGSLIHCGILLEQGLGGIVHRFLCIFQLPSSYGN